MAIAITLGLILVAFKGASATVMPVTPPSPPKKGPPRYVGGTYDRLPSLQDELAKRQEASRLATQVIQGLDNLAKYRPLTMSEAQRGSDMMKIASTNVPKIAQLQAAIDEIARAGQL